jgi:serine protease Do
MSRLVTAFLCAGAVAIPADNVAVEIAAPSVVPVAVSFHGWVRDDRTGEVFGGRKGYTLTTSCSGSVINGDGYVATAGACVDGTHGLIDLALDDLAAVGRVRDRALARQQLVEHAVVEGARPGSPVERRIQVERPGGKDAAPADVVATEGDVAVLKVARSNLPAIEVVTGDVSVGTPVLVLGYTGVVQHGQVTAHRGELLEVSVGGTSGGAVVDRRGRLVGVIVQPSPALAAEGTTLTEVLRGKGVRAALGPGDRDYRAGLDAYFAGDYDTAVAYLDAVLAGTPGHQQAREYRDRAAARGGRAPTNGLLVVLLVLAAVVALGAGAGAIALTVRNRRMDTPTPPYGFPMERPR